MKSRTDYEKRAIVCMNKEAGQNPQIISRRNKSRDDLTEARMANMALTQLKMVHTKASSRIRRNACLGKPRSINSYI